MIKRGPIYRHACAAAAECGLGVLDLYGPSRARSVVAARWLAWRRASAAGHSAASIAREFGRNHTSVLHALKAQGPAGAPLDPVEVVRPSGAPPRLLVIGHGGHGKDTAAEILARRFGGRFVSSSAVALRVAVWPLVSDIYPAPAAAWADRRRNRALWFHAIAAYNLRPGCPPLAEVALLESDIFCGIRKRSEFEAVRGLFDLVLWVDRSRHVPPEPAGSMELTAADADLVLDNNADVAALESGAVAALLSKGWPPVLAHDLAGKSCAAMRSR